MKMPSSSFLLVCLVLLKVMRSDNKCTSRPITCDAGTYYYGESASVSCNLHLDMNACQLNVFVVHYPTNAPENEPGTEIVSCRWEETKKEHQCRVDAGFAFKYDIGDHPELQIHVVNNATAGFYMCYVMPSNNTSTHVCKLTPEVRTGRRTTLPVSTPLAPRPAGGHCEPCSANQPYIGAVAAMAIIMVILLVVLVVCYRHRLKRCKNKCNFAFDEEQGVRESLLSSKDGNGNSVVKVTPAHKNREIEAALKGFRLEDSNYQRIMTLLERKMSGKEIARTKVTRISNGKERGDCLVAVLNNSSLKVVLVRVQGQHIDSTVRENYKITTAIRQGPGEQLLQFITTSIKDFVSTHNLSGQTLNVGFVFSFPCKHDASGEQQGLTNAQLTRWTKEFDCSDIVGKNLGDLLQAALRTIRVCELNLKVVVNDVVDMLVSAAYDDPGCKIALVLGDGVNACYSQRDNNVYNTTEFGSCGDGGCFDLFRTEFDIDLDQKTLNKGQQILEKMMSLLYLGELVRLVLVKLTDDKLLFTSVSRESALYKPGSFKTDFIPLVDRDTDGDFRNTEHVLIQLEVESITAKDCRTVQYVCRLISERAAHLAATVLAVLVKRVGQPEVTVAIDESLDRFYPRIYQRMLTKIRELVGEQNQINIKTFPNESGKGAAILAAATQELPTR